MKKLLALTLALAMLLLAVPAMSLAETATDTSAEAPSEANEDDSRLGGLKQLVGAFLGDDENGEGEKDLDSLLDMLSTLGASEKAGEVADSLGEIVDGAKKFSEAIGADGETNAADLVSLFSDMMGSEGEDGGMLSGLMGMLTGGKPAPAPETVKAESIDQFYGNWMLNRVELGDGITLSPDMLKGLGIEVAAGMSFSADGLVLDVAANGKDKEAKAPVEPELKDGCLSLNVKGEVLSCALTAAGELVCGIEDIGYIYFAKAE